MLCCVTAVQPDGPAAAATRRTGRLRSPCQRPGEDHSETLHPALGILNKLGARFSDAVIPRRADTRGATDPAGTGEPV